ncbi:DUF6701 domain-containing protein [Vibrio cincinnatiensis]|uniref:DUF6701 domain-containing protein n=1 Tax=Vibrio cincinnatiensis TaxID=675 RepID=UPI001EDEB79E|nr:DUF6701 domain-containing protein [Vibrio cincinnatiensis]MCG3730103.1 hypothetical protein [Vibrio cincinnatiensis]
MKKYWLIAFSFLLFISQSVLAEQCDLKGQKYFTIQFDVIGSPGNLQEVYIKKGNKRWQTLWYTEKEQKDSDYIFNEQGLIKDIHYQVRIINDGNNNILKYYLKRQSSANDNWVFIEQQKKEIASGQLSVYSNTGLDVDDLTCEESSVEPEEPPPFDQCEFFPQPIQSWITEGSSDYADFPPSNLNIQNPSPISGWTDAYVNDPRNILQMSQSWDPNKTWNVLKVGFDQVGNSYFAYEDPNSVVCNGMGCYPGNEDKLINQRKAETPAPLDIDFLDQNSVKIVNTSKGEEQPLSYKNICNANSVTCKYEENGDLVIITLYKDLKELELSTWGDKDLILKFLGDRKVETFKYDASGKSITVYFSKLSIVSFGRIEGAGSAIFSFESNAKVNIVDSFTPSNPLEFKYIENSSDYVLPIIYGPKAKFLLRSNGELKGYLLAKEIEIPNSLVMEGSITTNLLTVASGLTMKKVTDGPECWEADEPEVEDEYELTLQPSVDYSLVCSTQLLQFQVNNAGKPTGEFTGSINVSPFANLTLVSGKGTGSNGNYTPNGNGELWFDLSSSVSQSFTITGTLNPKGDSSSAIGTYHFVPYKFAAEDQYVIANKPQDVSVKVLACNEGDVVDMAYNGQPMVTSEWQAPLNGVGNVTFSPNFNAGNVTADSQKLVMEESGIRTVTMTDANFDCSDPKYNCPIEGKGKLQGSFTVYSRPWTFAICSSDGKSMDGNIEDRNSVGFASAGSPFDLHIRPLRWVSSSGDNSDPQVGDREIETSAYCSSPVTQNFFATDASLEAKVLLTHNVAEPEDGNNGELSGSLQLTNRDGIDSSYLPFHNLAWDEVGVLRVNADLERDYLGMTVNQGYRNIGRFYPDHLEIISNDWKYADGHDGFVYMNQTIPYIFTVEAQNKQGKATANYSAFSEPLIVNIELLAVKELENGGVEELNDRIKDYHLQSWNGLNEYGLIAWSGAQLSISSNNNFTFLKKQQSTSPYITSVDGPYQSGFGLRVTDKVDDVDFTSLDLASNTAKQFTTQPDIRYGRMRLMDVGGTSVEPIAVPLRVEFWQGSRFVTNTQDKGSTFSTDENLICKQIIWSYSDNASLSKLSGAVGLVPVVQGESSAIKAEPSSDTENIREQVRFWLRLDDDDTNNDSQQKSAQVGETSIECPSGYLKQPWLRYNWRAKGDEDPSTVVTFGIFRGNDRVIFRGEPGLTGH